MPARYPLVFAASITAVSACGSEPRPPAVVDCDEVTPKVLTPGEQAVVDAAETACVRLRGPGGPADYLVVAYSAAGEESRDGTSADYVLTGATGTAPPAASVHPRAAAVAQPTRDQARAFHDRLRATGRDLARTRPRHAAARRSARSARLTPPTMGEQRTFNVLRSADAPGTSADDFVPVTGTASYVGTHVVIFLDDAAPTDGGYTSEDLADIGQLFDEHLHAIDVEAFGPESDVNSDGAVLVLLTEQVTRLAGCGSGQVVVGYFFAVDLLPDLVGSNDAEVFYGLTPDPSCGVTHEIAVSKLPGVFIHEFQHMINYGQKVLQNDGEAEDVWLDEGLATFAEELGARLVPSDRCFENDCLTQFHADNLRNAYRYLNDPGVAYLVGPNRPPLPLSQYGADWLFVRWMVDHYADSQPLGSEFTRGLVQSDLTGVANLENATGTTFDRLIAEWQLANYLDDAAGFQDLTAGSHFEYTSWNFREVFASFNQQNPTAFPRPYPLVPDVFDGDSYSRQGSLNAGSGQHILVHQEGTDVDLQLTAPSGGAAISAAAGPRIVVLRLR